MQGFLNRWILAQARLPDAGGPSGTSGRGRRKGDAGVFPRFFLRQRANEVIQAGFLDSAR